MVSPDIPSDNYSGGACGCAASVATGQEPSGELLGPAIPPLDNRIRPIVPHRAPAKDLVQSCTEGSNVFLSATQSGPQFAGPPGIVFETKHVAMNRVITLNTRNAVPFENIENETEPSISNRHRRTWKSGAFVGLAAEPDGRGGVKFAGQKHFQVSSHQIIASTPKEPIHVYQSRNRQNKQANTDPERPFESGS